MQRFHIHRDGTIYVQDAEKLWEGDAREFQTDFGRPAAFTPGDEHFYLPGKQYWVERAGRRRNLPPTWAAADLALAGIDAAIASRAARNTPTPTDPGLGQLKRNALIAQFDALVDERITAGTATVAEIAYAAARNA